MHERPVLADRSCPHLSPSGAASDDREVWVPGPVDAVVERERR
jgi:hypothetical protein